jgi:hypothetical protein
MDKEVSFSESTREALERCHKIAKETGLSEMTKEEINAEIQAVRDNVILGKI